MTRQFDETDRTGRRDTWPNGLWTAAVLAAACLAAPAVAVAQGPGSLPFSSTYRRPSVSPFQRLAQFNQNPLTNQNTYQTLVQPAVEQQRMQLEQLSQGQRLGGVQQQVQGLERSSQARQIDETIRPTGHASTYMNYSHYYRMGR
jgi:hypothetical protein